MGRPFYTEDADLETVTPIKSWWREWRENKQQEAKAARQFWVFWSIVGAAVVGWYVFTHYR
jgi:hypothetical protein